MTRLSGSEPLPAVLFDRVVLRIRLHLAGLEEGAFQALRYTLEDRNQLSGDSDTERLNLSVPVVEHGQQVAAVAANFLRRPTNRREGTLRDDAQGELLLDGTVELNGMRLLRCATLSREPLGFDRNDNLIGSTHETASALLMRQLELIAACIGALAEALDSALGYFDVVEERLTISAAEICVDLPSADAASHVRALSASYPSGTKRGSFEAYRSGHSDDGRCPAITWTTVQHGPVLKTYAKRADIVRVEVACRDRRALRYAKLQPTLLSGTEAVAELLKIARAAEPSIQKLVAHAGRIQPQLDIREKLTALRPLHDLAAGERGAGRPPSTVMIGEAGRAYLALLNTGICSCPPQFSKGTALRRVLDQMCEADGPLQRLSNRAVYVLRGQT